MSFLEIAFEDDDFVAVVKPAGMVVHSSRETGDDLLSTIGRRIGRPVFAFHRLDKGTSGLVLLGKRRGPAAADMTQAFEKKRVRKAYLAVVSGAWPATLGRVDAPLEKLEDRVVVSERGKPSLTTFRRLVSSPDKSLIEALPKTGRTHQIRVHCAHAGHPILGDARYGKGGGREAIALHAHSLAFEHPRSRERLVLRSLPGDWRDTWLSGLDVEAVWARLAP